MSGTQTIQELIDNGDSLRVYCNQQGCFHSGDIDLHQVARVKGYDWNCIAQRWPYKCSKCGSRNVGVRLNTRSTFGTMRGPG